MMSERFTPPSREPIDQISVAVFAPMAVRAALQLDLFSALAKGSMTAKELAETLEVKPRRFQMLLYALVVAEFLELRDGRFANSAMADYYLVKGRPEYAGAIHGFWTELWTSLIQTADSIRTDIPQAKIDFEKMSQAELSGFLKGLHGDAAADGRYLAQNPRFAEATRMVDVGGGSGGIAISLCQEHAHLTATLIDLPAVIPIAQEMIAEAGLGSRITAETTDLLSGPLAGKFEIAVARNLFQVLSAEQCQKAAQNIASALPVGGTFYVIGRICDDTRLSPVNNVYRNLMFLNAFDNGEAYTESQYRGWLEHAGFGDVTRESFPRGGTLMAARKA
jgi:hypothetical protein